MAYRSFHEIIDTDIDRKEFLQYLGVLLLLVTGISGIAQSLAPTPRPRKLSGEQTAGYGNSPYGY